jgi:hypothetical protein
VTELRERDAMICRSCGQEERASEGYPCKDCGTFICIMCVFKGVVRCERCTAAAAAAPAPRGIDSGASHATPSSSEMDWPEH